MVTAAAFPSERRVNNTQLPPSEHVNPTFLFHAEPALLPNRAAYETLWTEWERDGFRVLPCRSLDARIDLLTDDVAVFTHSVRTRLAGAEDEQRERKTIVFHRESDGRWLGVHEHLSLDQPAV